jgi:hypothetical protein
MNEPQPYVLRDLDSSERGNTEAAHQDPPVTRRSQTRSLVAVIRTKLLPSSELTTPRIAMIPVPHTGHPIQNRSISPLLSNPFGYFDRHRGVAHHPSGLALASREFQPIRSALRILGDAGTS